MTAPAAAFEFGLETFGDVTRDGSGRLQPHAAVIRNVVEEGVLADEVGIDFFGIGEHHRADFAVSSPEMVLAAIASRTSRIRLGSAVTVLSSDEPVRVFQRFSTLDAISNGRAEIILGRGSFTESFPLFGFPLDQYETLFEERLELFAAVMESDRTGTPVTWRGTTRAPVTNQRVYPSTSGAGIKCWIGVGGSPESVVRAARYKMPLMLAIIGGSPTRFLPYIDLYHRALGEFGAEQLPIGVHSHGHVGESDRAAREELWPAWRAMRDQIGSERGWPPTSRAEFDREAEVGSLYVGAPDTVARRIATTVQAMGLSRFDIKYSAGTLSHEALMRSIRLFGEEVAPTVRSTISAEGRPAATARPAPVP